MLNSPILSVFLKERGSVRMHVKINGKAEDVQEATVLDLLKSRSVDLRMVAVEVNSEMIERERYETTVLKEGDEVEFLYFMGGGVR